MRLTTVIMFLFAFFTIRCMGFAWNDEEILPQNKNAAVVLPSPLNPSLGIVPAAATNATQYAAVTGDTSGNVVAVGRRSGTNLLDYGGGNSVTGGHTNYNNLVVKYNAAGTVQWVKSVTTASNQSRASGVAADASGNFYVSGVMYGNGSFNFGSGAITSPNNNNNPYLIKYGSSGTVLWARTISTGSSQCEANTVAADAAGNVYLGGYVDGISAFNFGGQSVSGVVAGRNIFVAKYDTNGNVLWAIGVASGTRTSDVTGLAIDSATGDILVSGQQTNAGTNNYGPIPVTTTVTGNNALILRLSSAGTFLQARSVATATNISRFKAIALSPSGDVYACGFQYGNTPVNFGGVTVSGSFATGNNYLVVRYAPDLTPVWARSTVAPDASECSGISAGANNRIATAGFQVGTGNFDFGGATVAGVRAGDNSTFVQFAPGGQAVSASSVTLAPDGSRFDAAHLDANGVAHAAGYQDSGASFTYGGTINVVNPFAAGTNAVLVKYQ